ncbi:4-galactosyl-N-acetylglucosaminide 3-alpha-L-fucosyltransferase 9-like isoform X2 [Convolutriloba macropyga]
MDGNGLQKNGTRKIAQVNVSVLVYTWAKRRQEHMRELRSEGNLRKECSLQFDCIYKQRDNHVVTADMFYSMDAVIVGTQAVRNLKADITKFNGSVTLKTRKSDQIWVGHSSEPASDTRTSGAFAAEPILNQMFNWTIFLSRNATIQKKFGYFYKKNEHELSLTPADKLLLHTNRSKDFCWIISNCADAFHNSRNKIVQSLIQSLSRNVHIWGSAIKAGCVNGSLSNVVDHGNTGEKQQQVSHLDVPQMLAKDCKFYFAFENSNCTDFVTTRFITSIVAGAVPIVMGRLDTYNKMLPGSFIHLSDFSSLSQLSKYLENLLKDEKKMNKYHEWRKFYTYEQTGAEAACELCKKLEKLKRAQKAGHQITPTVIPNMAEHYKSLQTCSPIDLVPIETPKQK